MENENLIFQQNKKNPLFFVDNSKVSISVYVIYDLNTGELYSAAPYSLQTVNEIGGVAEIKYDFVFTKPNYEQLSNYKQLSSYWDNNAAQKVINVFKLRSYLIVNHLKSWDNIKNENGEDIVLQVDDDGTLKQNSLDLVYGVNPFVMEAVMKEYQKKIHLNLTV